MLPQKSPIKRTGKQFLTKVIVHPVPCVSHGAMSAAEAMLLLMPPDPADKTAPKAEELACVIESASGLRSFLRAIRIPGETEETRLDWLAVFLRAVRTVPALTEGETDISPALDILDELLSGLQSAYRMTTFEAEEAA